MAKLYNIKAYSNTAANWATDTIIYPTNSLLIETDTGIMKKGNGVDAYADLDTVGAKQVAEVADITDWPETFPPKIGTTGTTAAAGNHDHAIAEDVASGLVAAANLQALAIALSARIKALEDAP